MRVRLPLLVAAGFSLGSCGGGAPAPSGLAYGLPNPTTATYMSGDTVTMDIDAGGQSMQMTVGTAATYGASFTRAADGVRVSMSVEDFSARMNQPMGGPITADEAGVDGPLVFTLDRRGNVTIDAQPTLSGNARQFFAPLTLAHTFFPGLPGRSVDVGDSWTDTVRYQGSEGTGEVDVTAILTYTVAGDEMAEGRNVVRINFTGTSESNSSGNVQGMDVAQSLTGDVQGYILWDMAAGLLVESYGDGTARGSLEVAAAPFPLGVRARQQSRTKLSSGM